jgi:hypothetical protein
MTTTATAVKAVKVFRGKGNLPQFLVAITDATGKALSKIYTPIGERSAGRLALDLCRQHRLPLIRA